jgi:hypothetical protein
LLNSWIFSVFSILFPFQQAFTCIAFSLFCHV